MPALKIIHEGTASVFQFSITDFRFPVFQYLFCLNLKMTRLFLFAIISSLLIFQSCANQSSDSSVSSPIDSVAVANGELLFAQQCSSCHNFTQDAIGPQLSGVAVASNATWIHDFIKNPKGLIESGDEQANALQKKFHAVMPGFPALTDENISDITAFLRT